MILASALVLFSLYVWRFETEEGIVGVLFSALIWGLMLHSLSGLRGVRVDDRFLHLDRGGEESVVPLCDVTAVETSGHGLDRCVTLRYWGELGEKRWIWFLARSDQDFDRANRWTHQPHPVVEELRHRIAAQAPV